MAHLEAQHTSPISASDVTILVRRLTPWAFNAPSDFVAVYLRAGDVAAGESFDIEVQGRKIRIDVPSRARREAEFRERAWLVGSAAVIVLILAGLTLLALQRRAALEDRLALAELRVARQEHAARAIAKAKSDARALTALDLNNQGIDLAIRDLQHVAATKDTNVRVDAFFWRKGYWAVEAHGDAPPVHGGEGDLQRSVRPIRPGVWLWAGKSDPGAKGPGHER